jgi:hypothetical protein
MTVNKAAPLFFVLRSSLVALAATHADRRCTRFSNRAPRFGCGRCKHPAGTSLVIHKIAVTVLSRAEFGCHYTDMEIE